MNALGAIASVLGSIILGVAWLAGFVLAHGFWQTLGAFIPFYAWYLVVERVMLHLGIV